VANITTQTAGLFKGGLVGAEAYAAYVNASGGVHGRRIVVQGTDDQFSGATNKQLTQEAVDTTFAAVGDLSLEDGFGGTVLAANPQFPNVSESLDPVTRKLPNTFSAMPSAQGFPLGPLAYFAQRFPAQIKHTGTIVADLPTTVIAWNNEKAAMTHEGYQVLYSPALPPTQTDFTAQVVAMGPRLQVRDQATLRARFPGRSDDDIAGLLVERAARATAAVGGATGACAALPALPAFPVEVAAETLAVVGIEIKLLAELHEIYGQPAVGSAADRARAYIGAWASRRGVYQVDGGLLLIAGSPLARQLTRRLAARVRRSAFSLSPLLTGALAGVLLNRRETRRLGRQIRDDLRSRRTTFTASVIGRPTATPGV